MPDSLEQIYAAIPNIECKRLCQECCGPIFYTPTEERAMQKANRGPLPPLRQDMTCGLLQKNGACKVYGTRPLICRLFGVVTAMQCPHGCVPERWLSEAEVTVLMRRVEQL